jgi:hypothetical protein
MRENLQTNGSVDVTDTYWLEPLDTQTSIRDGDQKILIALTARECNIWPVLFFLLKNVNFIDINTVSFYSKIQSIR